LTEGTKVTTEEKDQISKMMRLVKNRESAQTSRQRKKDTLDYLKQQVEELQKEKSFWKKRAEDFKEKLSQHDPKYVEQVESQVHVDIMPENNNNMEIDVKKIPSGFKSTKVLGVVNSTKPNSRLFLLVFFGFALFFAFFRDPLNFTNNLKNSGKILPQQHLDRKPLSILDQSIQQPMSKRNEVRSNVEIEKKTT